MQNTPTSTKLISNSQLGLKTCQLLLVNYNNIFNAILKPGADKLRFQSLIKELEADIELLESFPETQSAFLTGNTHANSST